MRITETERLRNLFGSLKGRGIKPGLNVFDIGDDGEALDSIDGWDEMQGYPDSVYGQDLVGFDPSILYNPFTQMHAAGDFFRNRGHGTLGNIFDPVGMMQGRQGRGGGQTMRSALPAPPQLPPGAVQAYQRGPAKLLSYMGVGVVSWESTDTLIEKVMIAEPQAAFRGRRLVIDVASTQAGILTTITSPLTVSGMPQTPAPSQPAPTSMFKAETTYSLLDLQVAVSGTQIALGISVSAIPGTGQTVTAAAGLYGEWLR